MATTVIPAGSSGEANTINSRSVTLTETPLSTDALLLVELRQHVGIAVSEWSRRSRKW